MINNNRFIAIDFETANYKMYSACALGIVVVDDLKITDTFYSLIRPPENYFIFTHIHGITWRDVSNAPTFTELWPDIGGYFNNIDFAAAHNAAFDRPVLEACCGHYGIVSPDIRFRCTLQLSRQRLKLKSRGLQSVSDYFGIELDHHNALSDSLACAKIMINFMKQETD